jgi:hypothetical protein
MSKVVDAANAMIVNSRGITNVLSGANNKDEYFFVYEGKHKWSISRGTTGGLTQYWLYYYPGEETIEQLAALEDWDEYSNYAYYTSKQIGAEAREAFGELYALVKDRRFNMGAVFDDIIKPPRS